MTYLVGNKSDLGSLSGEQELLTLPTNIKNPQKDTCFHIKFLYFILMIGGPNLKEYAALRQLSRSVSSKISKF